jgi:hypothetical protein
MVVFVNISTGQIHLFALTLLKLLYKEKGMENRRGIYKGILDKLF